MSGGIIDRLRKWFSTNDSYEDYSDEISAEEGASAEERKTAVHDSIRSRGNLVALPKVMTSQKEIAIFRVVEGSRCIEKIGDALKNDVAVLVNFVNVSDGFLNSVKHFLMGIVYAEEGSSQKITDSVYCFTPHSIKLTKANDDEPVSDENISENLEKVDTRAQRNNVRNINRRDW